MCSWQEASAPRHWSHNADDPGPGRSLPMITRAAGLSHGGRPRPGADHPAPLATYCCLSLIQSAKKDPFRLIPEGASVHDAL